MIAQGAPDATSLVANLTRRALTVAVDKDEVLSWDRQGRLYSHWHAGRTRRRGLSGRVLEKWHDASGVHRRSLTGAAADAVVDRAARVARAAVDGRDVQSPGAGELRAVLERAAGFDAAAGRQDVQRFRSIYGEIGILPPDQYLALVVQATEGCSFGSCSFCALYKEPFRARTVTEFAGHLDAVRAYMGESLSLRGRSVFLGAANALTLPMSRLVPFFDLVATTCSRPPIGAFVDGFTGSHKTVEDYQALAARGLRRVYIGLESGHDPLLSAVGKPGCAADARQAAVAIKAAGVSVGIIILIGLGGDRYAADHVRDTVATLNAMPLGAGDLVYFSDLIESDGGRESLPTVLSARALTEAESRMQQQRIQSGLVFAGAPPQMARYDLREFVY